MKSVIHKHTLRLGLNTIDVPAHFDVLSVGLDPNDHLCMWYRRHPENSNPYQVKFLVVFTGEPFDISVQDKFIGTVLCNSLVFHIYQLS